MEAPMAEPIEIQLEHYLLLEELSQNSVITVYRGQRKTDEQPVIVKVVAPLSATDEFFVRRIKQATRQTAKLEHPNIVPSHEAEQEGELLYLVEDLDVAAARSLAQVLAAEGPFSPRRMQLIARQIASALDYAHQKSITHGDLSAHEVYLGSEDNVLITNFGQTQAIFGVTLMRQSYAAGAPEIMAPERVHGQGPSRHSDLYALGILGYQMLAGKPPFTGSPAAVLHAQAYKQPRPLYVVNPGIPVAVSEVIERMLAKGMELRYNTGAEFARALVVASEGSKTGYVRRGLQPEQSQSFLSRKTITYLFGTALLAALALLWLGYKLGLDQRPTFVAVAPAFSTPLGAGALRDINSILPTSTPTTVWVTSTPTVGRIKLSDTLPTATYTPIGRRDRLLPTPTLSPAFASPTPTATATPLPNVPAAQPAAVGLGAQPVIPAGKGLLTFYNPTGHDLIVDLTGPTSSSALVPPNRRLDFVLIPGRYQCIIHTPTGQFLASRTLEFDVPADQAVEKDYYTDYKTP
jgi:serine/threonine protein kinase